MDLLSTSGKRVEDVASFLLASEVTLGGGWVMLVCGTHFFEHEDDAALLALAEAAFVAYFRVILAIKSASWPVSARNVFF